MNKLPSVQVIVLNWNGRSFLDACLSALSNLDYPVYSILLVDNDSTDDSVDFVRRRFQHVTILHNEKNLGYAGGNNRALTNLSADYAVLVNPDIIVAPDWLTQLISPMHAGSSIGIAGCKLHYPDGQIIQHAGGAITHPQALPLHQGMYEADTGQYETLRDVDYVTGAAIAISRPALERIGLLDEGFFMYFEEADYCARARAAGYRVAYIPRATAVHDESAIAVKGSFSYLQRFHTGRWRYLLKHFSPDEILSTTVTAEELWLAERQSGECRALNRAYRAVRAGLDEILTTRIADGSTEIDAGQKALIAASLLGLRKAALEQAIDQEQHHRLAQKASVKEMPLRSKTAVVGPLIARLRTLWAAVAVRKQARSFTTQQSEINQVLANELHEIENRIQTVQFGLLEHDERQVEIKRQQLKVRAELSQAYKLIDSIEARLERLEKLPRDR